jgi:hypothetical protein
MCHLCSQLIRSGRPVVATPSRGATGIRDQSAHLAFAITMTEPVPLPPDKSPNRALRVVIWLYGPLRPAGASLEGVGERGRTCVFRVWVAGPERYEALCI